MLDPILLRDNLEAVRTGLRNRGLDADEALAQLTALDAERRRLIPEIEGLKREQNSAGEQVAQAKRQGLDTTAIQEANKARGQQIKQLDVQLAAIDAERNQALLVVPNLPHASVPVGRVAADNAEVRRHGEPRSFDFEPQAHWDLGPALGIVDFERAVSALRRRGSRC